MYRKKVLTLRSGLVIALILISVAGSMSFLAVGQDDSMGMSIEFLSSEIDLTGDWFLRLDDEAEADLALQQVDGEAFGYGNLTIENATKEIAAGGFVEDDYVTLYLIAFEGDMMFKLNFTAEDKSISGSYIGYSDDGKKMNGTLSGSMYIGSTAKFGYTSKKKSKSGSD